MENNKIIKFEGGLVNHVGSALNITNKLLSVNLRPLKILHLDDHILYSKGVTNYCTNKKFPNAITEYIQDGDKALEYVINSLKNNETIDLIITDVNHMGLNGIDFSIAVRKNEKNIEKKIPILFITMVDDKFIREKARQLPFVIYLLKTSQCEEINFAIDNLI